MVTFPKLVDITLWGYHDVFFLVLLSTLLKFLRRFLIMFFVGFLWIGWFWVSFGLDWILGFMW